MIFALGVGWGFLLAFLLWCARNPPLINEPEDYSFPGSLPVDEPPVARDTPSTNLDAASHTSEITCA